MTGGRRRAAPATAPGGPGGLGAGQHAGPARWRDLAFLVVLGALALSGLASTYSGVMFLAVGVIGIVLGAASVEVSRRYGWPLAAPVLLGVVVFVLLGGPLCLQKPFAPATLLDQAIGGWKDLLTTLPPVDGTGPLLVLPWLLGLLTGLVGALLLGVRASAPPVLAPLALLATVILLGVDRVSSLFVQGVLVAVLVLAWLALRAQDGAIATGRRRAVIARRAGAGVVMLVVAGAVAFPLGRAAAGDQREVLRSHVTPPFDIGRYGSPLSSFRRYVDEQGKPDPANLYDKTLFTISGVPAGTRVRFAALDRYDGTVWGASQQPGPDSFQRVSSTIDNPTTGKRVDVDVKLGEGYSSVWLPTVGALQSMHFDNDDPSLKASAFRYDLATSTGIVPTGLKSGDSYHFTGVLGDDALTADTPPSTQLTDNSTAAAFLDTQATQWTQGVSEPMKRVFAIADYLRTHGKYSDGVAAAERIYHAGHYVKRLSDDFVNAPIMVGDDEQYAAVMALMANRVGVPARVVMGAIVPAGGVVTGADVHAWVEVQAADGTWRTLPTDTFMSHEKPADQPPQQQEQLSGSVVPPPAPVPPPSNTGDSSDSELKARAATKHASGHHFHLPGWVKVTALAVGGPLLLIVLVAGAIMAAKALRRRRRRGAERTSARVAGAWRELVDHARDLGHRLPVVGTTRREQAALLDVPAGQTLARDADALVFGPAAPAADQADAYWHAVDEERARLSAEVTRWQRAKAAVSLVTFRPR
jgi:transglutaminase-like putative cysteine protease